MSNDSNGIPETLPSTIARREVGFYSPSPIPTLEATAAAPRNDSDLSLTELIALLAKRKKLIGAVTLGFFLFGFLYCLITPPLYTSTTTLEMRGYSPLLAGVQSEMLYGNDSRKIEFQKTTVAKLKLDGVADSVLARDNLALEVKSYFDSRKGMLDRLQSKIKRLFAEESKQSVINEQDQHFVHKPSLISKYLSLIDVNPVHETNLVEIAVTTGSPSLSQHIANAHAQGFIDYLARERQEAISANVQLLERQADDVKTRVQAAEKALADYAKENRLISLSENSENRVILRQMEQLAELLAEATSKRVRSESILKELESKGPDDNNALDDEGIRSLRLQMKQAETEYTTLGSKATAEYPAMKDLRARIGALRTAILTERKRLTEGLRNQYKSEKEAETKLREQIEAEKVRAQEGSRSMIQYNILLKEASSLRDLYTSVLKQVAETKISAASASSNVFVTDYASYPTSASAPKTKLIMVLMTLLGAVAGTALAVVLQFMDSSLKSSHDTQRSLDLPILGAVPSFSPEARNERLPFLQRITNLKLLGGGTPNSPSTGGAEAPPPVSTPFEFSADASPDAHHKELITVSSPQDYVSEALRTIRASILLSSADHPPKVIMVTSSKKGEGKTSIISNLAVTLAQAYHKTLVIDCDLRQSRLSRMFGQRSSDGPGLSDVLAGQATLGEAICETSIPALHLFRAGSRPPNPVELLGSQTMKFLISELSKEYEFILIDSPPVLPLADTLMLSRLVDSVVLVVRSHVTEKPLALEARRRLLRVNARILGIVINDVPPKTASEEYDLMYESYGEPPAAGAVG